MTTNSSKNSHDSLIHLIGSVIKQDDLLRQKYQVENRFVFVRNQLQSLLAELQNNLLGGSVVVKKDEQVDEVNVKYSVVYVYLYNAQGLQLKSWLAFLTAKALYEHSVNRPIFTDKNAIKSMLKSKPNPAQHAYLVISTAEQNIIEISNESGSETSLVRVKEGAFSIEKIVSFVHNEIEYLLDSQGKLVKKD